MHFPDWLGSWFYDELTYEERSSDGKWSKPGRGANEAFDLMVYAEALVILHGYEKIRWPDAPEWASRETGWSVSRTVPNRHPHRNRYPRLLKNKNGRKQ